jgi:hypothetical protein
LAEQAKVQAFLSVDLFKKIYDQFHGTTLPPEVGLKNLLETTYRVVPDRVTPTVRIMLDSEEYAGLFKAAGNRTRMTMPLTLPGGSGKMVPPQPAAAAETPKNGGGNGGGGGDGTEDGIDSAIRGLLRRLPPSGTPLTAKRRKDFIDAFTALVTVIYPEAETE